MASIYKRVAHCWNILIISFVNLLLCGGSTASLAEEAARSLDQHDAKLWRMANRVPKTSANNKRSVVAEDTIEFVKIPYADEEEESRSTSCCSGEQRAVATAAPTPAPIKVRPNKYFLGIGINYRGTANQLEGCINDVKNMQALLTDPKLPFKYNYVSTMTDDTPTKPTRANMILAINQLITRMQPGDTAVIHYSGHGSQSTDRNKDEADGLDETLVPSDFNSAGMLIDDDLYTLSVRALVAQGKTSCKLFIFLDCCHSASNFDLRYCNACSTSDSIVTTTPSRATGLNANVVVFAACKDNQTATDLQSGTTPQGEFTAVFVNVIKAAPTTLTWRQFIQRTHVTTKPYNQMPYLSTELPLNLDSVINF